MPRPSARPSLPTSTPAPTMSASRCWETIRSPPTGPWPTYCCSRLVEEFRRLGQLDEGEPYERDETAGGGAGGAAASGSRAGGGGPDHAARLRHLSGAS